MYQSLSNPNQQYMGKKPLNLSLSIFILYRGVLQQDNLSCHSCQHQSPNSGLKIITESNQADF